MKKPLDDYEKRILKEVIRDPRISDNQITRKTKIPLKTVNRKRKKLEKNGVLNYFAYVNNGPNGTKNFTSMQMYIVKLKHGISRMQYLEAMSGIDMSTGNLAKHINSKFVSEKDGQLTLIFHIESRDDSDILEIFNIDVINDLKSKLGENCVSGIEVYRISNTIRLMHNYLLEPGISNMENGRIKDDWKDEYIFVD